MISTITRLIRGFGGRGAAVAGGAGIALAAMAIPASAHVTVDAPGATQGGMYQLITVKVPNESDTASTTDVKLALPSDTPVIGVSVQQVAGWTITVKTTKLPAPVKQGDDEITESVSQIEWKANPGSEIGPNQFQQFVISAGQLPDSKTVTFKAVQTYSDGQIVNWIDMPAAGSTAEPEHPAPTLTLAPKSSGASPSPSAPTVMAGKDDDSSTPANIGLGLGGGALLIAVIALLVGLRSRRTGANAS